MDEQDVVAAAAAARFVAEADFAVSVKSVYVASSVASVCFVVGLGLAAAVRFAAGTDSVAAAKLAGELCSSDVKLGGGA